MKFFVVSVLLAVLVASSNAAGLTDEQKAKVIILAKGCIDETGVNKDLVFAARKGKFSDDPKLAAFAFCMSKKVGFQNAAGDIQEGEIRQKLTGVVGADAANKLIATCLAKKDTPEATAAAVFKCYYANTPEHLSIV